ncbi:MAG: hypothetical protein IJ508_05395 [Oscillospiraceae bacterium]|nr:hypothetical protein [Oscillospiraceae bacterium]MBQ9108539.1 hypothetical protein [Oscillospiraceae bacterium]
MAETTARGARRRKGAAPIGAIFILLAVIGLVAVLIFTIGLTRNFVDNTAQKTEFEEMIRPVLMFDPVPFEDPNDLQPATLLQASMWSALLGEKRGSYQYDEMKLLVVPASDLDVNAQALFGPTVTLQHQTFGNYDATFVFDQETNTYRVPIVAQIGSYTPKIEKITQQGSEVLLMVGYLPPDTLWTAEQAQREDGQAQPDKHMIYVLEENDKGDYYISAIRDTANAGLPGGEYSGSEVISPEMMGNAALDEDALSKLEEERAEQEAQEAQTEEDGASEEEETEE